MSVFEELEEKYEDLKTTMGQSFNYGFLGGIVGAFAGMDVLTIIFGDHSLFRVGMFGIEVAVTLAAFVKQRIYVRRLFDFFLVHSHDKKQEEQKK